jgi:D-aminopeptidase
MNSIRRSGRRSARFIMMVSGKLRRGLAFGEPVCRAIALASVSLTLASPCVAQQQAPRPRARDIGLVVGIFEPGALDAITDVAGVRVGQTTVVEGDSVRTGVTAIIQHGGNVFQERVPAAIVVGNGFGKLAGSTQVRELGELETPVLLTCTLCVWRAADAMVGWLLEQPGMSQVRSINPVVGETNDGYLNDIRVRPVTPAAVRHALETAREGAVDEGAVGAGTGTVAFGWKGGIGTASRILPTALGGWTVGVLVQTNFGGVLTMNGAPVGRELGRYDYRNVLEPSANATRHTSRNAPLDRDLADGSIMIVVATDAPLDSRNLERLARRALVGVGRTGGELSNGSGDYVIAFSTSPRMRRRITDTVRTIADLNNEMISPLFQGVAEATEEAIYNSLLRATTTHGAGGHTVEALPLDSTMAVLRKYNVLRWDRRRARRSLRK